MKIEKYITYIADAQKCGYRNVSPAISWVPQHMSVQRILVASDMSVVAVIVYA